MSDWHAARRRLTSEQQRRGSRRGAAKTHAMAVSRASEAVDGQDARRARELAAEAWCEAHESAARRRGRYGGLI